MSLRFKFRFAFLLVLVVLVVGRPLLCFGVSNDDALSAISDAEYRIVVCYGAVADADKAGADVSELLSDLNDAGWFLSKAKLAYSEGDFDSAVAFANESQAKLEGFIDRADGLRQEAEHARYLDFMNNFVGSGIGALCIVILGFAFWIFLKRREEGRRRA